MRKILSTIAFLLFSFLGGAFAQIINLGTGSGGGIFSNAVAAISGFANGIGTGTASVSGNHWTNTYFPGVDAAGYVMTYSISPNGQAGSFSASRSSDNASGTAQNIISNTCLSVPDHTSVAHKTWCRYEQANIPANSALREHLNDENSIQNLAASVVADPFTPNPTGATFNLRLDSGTGSGSPNNVSGALHIIKNAGQYNSAIIIGNDAVSTNEAIALATNHKINYYSSASTVAAQILVGSGSPAATVTCSGRCIYIRTDGGASTTLYVAEASGSGNWVAK